MPELASSWSPAIMDPSIGCIAIFYQFLLCSCSRANRLVENGRHNLLAIRSCKSVCFWDLLCSFRHVLNQDILGIFPIPSEH
jgi:hypothetical protein